VEFARTSATRGFSWPPAAATHPPTTTRLGTARGFASQQKSGSFTSDGVALGGGLAYGKGAVQVRFRLRLAEHGAVGLDELLQLLAGVVPRLRGRRVRKTVLVSLALTAFPAVSARPQSLELARCGLSLERRADLVVAFCQVPFVLLDPVTRVRAEWPPTASPSQYTTRRATSSAQSWQQTVPVRVLAWPTGRLSSISASPPDGEIHDRRHRDRLGHGAGDPAGADVNAFGEPPAGSDLMLATWGSVGGRRRRAPASGEIRKGAVLLRLGAARFDAAAGAVGVLPGVVPGARRDGSGDGARRDGAGGAGDREPSGAFRLGARRRRDAGDGGSRRTAPGDYAWSGGGRSRFGGAHLAAFPHGGIRDRGRDRGRHPAQDVFAG